MNLELTPEQESLRTSVRRFLAERAGVADHVRPLLDSLTGTTDAVWKGLAELGTLGLLLPEEHGGTGSGLLEAGLVLEELGAALHPGPWLSNAVLVPRAFARFGIEAPDGVLAGIAEGTVRATLGPLTRIPALPRAVVTADGATELHGPADPVPDAAAADLLLMLADDAQGTGLYLVAPDAPGLDQTRRPHLDPTAHHFRVSFWHSPARRLGTVTEAARQTLLDDVLISRAADALGAARAVLGLAVEHAKVREQFGHPIGSFQAVQHLCAQMYETVELARGGVLHGLWAADHGSDEERHLAAVRAKAFSGRLAAVGDTAIQVLGGLGYTWEHDAHLYLKRLLGWSTFLGGPDVYLQELGTHVVQSGRNRA